jgi:chloramphenicol-sensitive protein RarD
VHERQAGILLGLLAYVIWGFLTIYWKALHDLGPIQLIGARIISSLVLLSVVLTVAHRWRRLQPLTRDRALLGRVAMAAVLLTGNWTAYVWAVAHDDIIQTALGYFIAPLGTVLIGVVVLGERVRPAQRIALGLAAVAVVELTVAYGRIPWIALVIAASWSLYGLFKRQVPLGPFESLTGETLVLLLPAVLVLLVPAAHGNGLADEASGAQMVLVALSGVATTVPLLMFAGAARRIPFTLLGPMLYIVPSINFLLGTLVYHEPLDGSQLLGFALVWVGLVIFTLDGVRASRADAAALETATVVA